MPLTDTDFTGKNEAKRKEDLDKLLKSVQQKSDDSEYSKLAVIILAAGLGKRMKDPEKPKVMFELKDTPMIEYVFETALILEPDLIVPVVGHHRQMVIDHLNSLVKKNNIDPSRVQYAVQEEQKGTGHAVMMTEDILKDFEGDILVLSGDTPMLSYETAEELINTHIYKSNLATLLTADVEDPFGYGRIVRDKDGNFVKIVEEKDTDDEQKKIREINAAIYVFNSRILFDNIRSVSPENKQNEYYLTDIFHFIPADRISTIKVENAIEISGINSAEQLKQMEELLNDNT